MNKNAISSLKIIFDSLKKAQFLTEKLCAKTKEPKLLIYAVEEIYIAQKELAKLLLQEKSTKDFKKNINLLKEQGKIQEKYLQVLEEVHLYQEQKKRAVTEFVRKDSYVICDNEYRSHILLVEEVNLWILQTKKIIKINYTKRGKH